jgi:hypothetical protein
MTEFDHSTESILAFCKEHFEYRNDGNLYWVKSRQGIRVGQRAGYLNSHGYRLTMICGRLYCAHRLIWLMHHGRWPTDQLDHIDRNRQNNRIENLREVTNAENHQNMSIHKDNKSGLPGVSWYKRDGKWWARGMLNGKAYHIGLFDCPIAAFRAFCNWCRANHPFTPYTEAKEAELIAEYLAKQK